MHVDIVDTKFDFTQNLGSNEDILTGALATAFYYCPKFTKLLFKELKIRYPYDNKYYVNTGWQINNDYKWLNKEINFKPDIMLSLSEEDWNSERDKHPDHEIVILVESKLFGAKLEKKTRAVLSRF